jgi:dTDP-4-amino-4,6-dideoxygalactose transaminase
MPNKKIEKPNNFITFGKPYLEADEINEVIDTLKSGWWGTGPKTERFENKFKKYAESKYALAVNSCTAGLFLALKVLDIKKGDEVITTPLTFCSTANVIIHTGAKPVFADVDPNDWNIDPTKIEQKITKKTKAILPVHLHGRPSKMDEILKIAKKYNLYVIEDAAHAAEARYKNKKIGNIGDITVFSFYVTKNLATGEGGMITTNNKSWIEQMRILSLHGLSRDAYKRYHVTHFENYECLIPGYKFNMTDIQASLGLHQLKRLKRNSKIRKDLWKTYDREFSKYTDIKTPEDESKDIDHARHLYAVLLPIEKLKISRDEFVDKLIKENIGSGVHFTPVHLHKYYQETYKFKLGDFPIAEHIGERIISLPLGANLSKTTVTLISQTVIRLIEKYKK